MKAVRECRTWIATRATPSPDETLAADAIDVYLKKVNLEQVKENLVKCCLKKCYDGLYLSLECEVRCPNCEEREVMRALLTTGWFSQ